KLQTTGSSTNQRILPDQANEVKLIKDKLNGFLMSGNETFPEGNPPGGDRPATGNEISEQPNPPQPPIRIAISSGHSDRVWGAERPNLSMYERLEAVTVVDRVEEILIERGVEVFKFHDRISATEEASRAAIVRFHNTQNRLLDVNIHFNATEDIIISRAVGPEVLYRTGNTTAAAVAQTVTDALYDVMYDASIIPKRVIFPRNDLPFLNDCNENPIIIEVCFVNSRADIATYRRKFEEICQAIADSLVEAAQSLRAS
ncbi:MAG: N-acetylmuramoyl-L-alanine amidase, partial [Spirochaetaceae bacterium]|nr:N-acetylmuramoyl-L-alanine amidase [Spirochaetaceae bacterium]